MPTFTPLYSIILELPLNNIIRGALALIAVAALPGCFTGIESTPSVSKAEVKRQKSEKPSAEQLLMAQVTRQPFGEWKRGKEFTVTDSKISLAFTPLAEAEKLAAGNVIRFREMRPALTVMGDTVAEFVFDTPSASTVIYRSERTPEQQRNATAVFVPFTVESSMVSAANALLSGKHVYILSSHRLDASGTHSLDSKKFVPVTIKSVVAGDSSFPLRIIFADSDGTEYSTFIAADTSGYASRTFSRLFSLTDPRLNYPQISNPTWELITRGKVAEDMTRDECRLALGSPDEVDRMVGISNTAERWTYSNGTVLFFEEGVLTKFR